ncbi:MAG TPA: TrkH family potassium uptake protein, partial [Rhodothermales bacterium]
WRSLTHWIGGMGIIVLTLAILPILGVGGMQLFRAEVPGPSTDKLTPRIRETAKRLWYVYVGLTVLHVLFLLPAMNLFEAINHAFATMGTGGFSTRDASVAAFDSPYVEWIITVFMFLAGMNFALHYRLVRGRAGSVFRDTELRAYFAIIVVATLFVAAGTWRTTIALLPGAGLPAGFEGYAGPLEALRYAAFQVVSIVTTTGYASADYELWPALSTGILFLMFFVGGMAGSTGGGVKVMRHVLLFKNSFREIKQLVHPQAVMPIRMNDQVVPPEVMRNVLSFAVLYFGLIALGTAVMALFGSDLLSAFGAAITCIGNVGPAFGTIGPTENFGHFSAPAKWTLSFLMMAGRLEVFTVLILFVPTFWRR